MFWYAVHLYYSAHCIGPALAGREFLAGRKRSTGRCPAAGAFALDGEYQVLFVLIGESVGLQNADDEFTFRHSQPFRFHLEILNEDLG